MTDKLNKYFILLNLFIGIVLVCCIVGASGAPTLNLTEERCRNCHGNEVGSTSLLHHSITLTCQECHIGLIYPDDWRNCNNCHIDFDHHNDVQGGCGSCHDDKQKRYNKVGAK